MRTAGMIGGLGPESTVDYYRSIIGRFRALKPDGGYPHVIINSLDVDREIALLDAGRLGELADYLTTGVDSLVRAGADFGFIAANTPHLVFDEVRGRSAIPLLSIVSVACDYTKALGLKKAGLFGTGFTMRASFYPEEFQRAGIALVRPKESEQEFIHGKYIGELLNNRFLPETRAEILNIAQRMRSEDRESVGPRRHGAACVARAANDQSADHIHLVAMQVIDGFGGGVSGVVAVGAFGILGGATQKFQVPFQDILDAEKYTAETGSSHQRGEGFAVVCDSGGHGLHEVINLVQPGSDDGYAQRLEAPHV
jgi:aspartate racemase